MRFIFLVTLILSLSSYSIPNDRVATDNNHYLYPRNREILYISGIENPYYSFDALKREKNICENSTTKQRICGLIEPLLNESRPSKMNYKNLQIEDTDLVIIGEMHPNISPKKIAIDIIEKDSSFTHLALEMFNQTSQEKINDFQEGKITADELETILSSEWSYNSAPYMELIVRANELGLKITALDNRKSVTQSDLSQNLIERDMIWAQKLTEIFKEDNSRKVLMLSGKLHSFKKLQQENSTNKIKTVVELINENITIKTKSFFVIEKREDNLFRRYIQRQKTNESQLLLNHELLQPYIDGLIFSL